MRSNETDAAGVGSRRALIIGCGNPLCGDDALGQLIAQRIAASPRPQRIGVIQVHQLTPELAEPISRAALVIFVDAAADLPPGRIRIAPIVWDVSDARASVDHHCSPQRLLATAQQLYAQPPEAWAIVAGGQSWDAGDALSPVVQRLVPRLLHYIELLIAVRMPAAAAAPAAAEVACA